MCLNCVDFCSRHISFSISSFCFSLCLLLRVFDFVISWAINDPDFPSACSASWSASFWRTSHTSFSTFLFFFLTLPAHLQQLSSSGLVWFLPPLLFQVESILWSEAAEARSSLVSGTFITPPQPPTLLQINLCASSESSGRLQVSTSLLTENPLSTVACPWDRSKRLRQNLNRSG